MTVIPGTRAKDGENLYLNSELRRKAAAVGKNSRDEAAEPTMAQVMALRIDFVARPGDTSEVATDVGDLLAQAGLHRKGLQASMLLVSDREVRLVTLLTLWDAQRFNSGRERLTSWTLKLVSRFADGPVRAYTGVANFLLPQAAAKLTLSDLEPAELAELVEIVAAG
jgi:hypothetical protein